MSFGWSNPPSTFMRLMNEEIKPFIGLSVIMCFDDIFVYNRNDREHKEHLWQVF